MGNESGSWFGGDPGLAGGLVSVARAGAGTKETSTLWTNAISTQLTDQPGPEFFPSLSPDGKSFVYASHAADNWDIKTVIRIGRRMVNESPFTPIEAVDTKSGRLTRTAVDWSSSPTLPQVEASSFLSGRRMG